MNEDVGSEIRKSRLQLTLALINTIIAALTLYLAYRQGGPAFSAPSLPRSPTVPSDYLLVVAGYMALTTAAAGMSRLIHHLSAASGYFASIVLVTLSIFLLTLILRTQGLTQEFSKASGEPIWIAYWGNVVMFLAINGKPAWDSIFTAVAGPNPDFDGMIGGRVAAVALLAIWCGAVAIGYWQITSALL